MIAFHWYCDDFITLQALEHELAKKGDEIRHLVLLTTSAAAVAASVSSPNSNSPPPQTPSGRGGREDEAFTPPPTSVPSSHLHLISKGTIPDHSKPTEQTSITAEVDP